MTVLQVIRGATTNETIQFVMEECCNCNIPFLMPKYFKDVMLQKREKGTFYCPNGHPQHYSGKNEAEELREQLRIERDKFNTEVEFARNKMLDAISEKQKIEAKLSRVHKGTCPCCNRSFKNLKRHMENKHPEIAGKKIYPDGINNKAK